MKNYIISLLLRILLWPLTLLPVKQKRVLFVSYRGKQYSCNPRYISQALEGRGLELGWCLKRPEKYRYLEQRGIKLLRDGSPAFIIYALTARVIVTNTYYKPYLPRRRGQFYLRTWHGGGSYKKVDYPAGFRGRYIRLQQSGASLYMSSSRAFTEETLRGSFGYKGEVLECGMPRNDLLLDKDKLVAAADAARAALGIPACARLCVYAPTWRDDAKGDTYGLDAARLKAALEQRFGGTWLIACRGHHALDTRLRAEGFDIDADGYPDMQELLAAGDALVTDYSSCIWDMSLKYGKVFLYCPDLDSYKAERDFYTDIHEWPFPLARDNAELEGNILAFDEAAYLEKVKAHHTALGACESGRAAELAAARVLNECGVKA